MDEYEMPVKGKQYLMKKARFHELEDVWQCDHIYVAESGYYRGRQQFIFVKVSGERAPPWVVDEKKWQELCDDNCCKNWTPSMKQANLYTLQI